MYVGKSLLQAQQQPTLLLIYVLHNILQETQIKTQKIQHYLYSRVVGELMRDEEGTLGGAVVGVDSVSLVEDFVVNFEVVNIHSTVK